jgi:hypothetical protein
MAAGIDLPRSDLFAAAKAVAGAAAHADAAAGAKEPGTFADAAAAHAARAAADAAAHPHAAVENAVRAGVRAGSDAARAAYNDPFAAGRFAVRRAVRADLDLLRTVAARERWTDATSVPPEFFGSLWTDRPPADWPRQEEPSGDAGLVIEFEAEADDSADEEVRVQVALLAADLDALDVAYGGSGLEVRLPEEADAAAAAPGKRMVRVVLTARDPNDPLAILRALHLACASADVGLAGVPPVEATAPRGGRERRLVDVRIGASPLQPAADLLARSAERRQAEEAKKAGFVKSPGPRSADVAGGRQSVRERLRSRSAAGWKVTVGAVLDRAKSQTAGYKSP